MAALVEAEEAAAVAEVAVGVVAVAVAAEEAKLETTDAALKVSPLTVFEGRARFG